MRRSLPRPARHPAAVIALLAAAALVLAAPAPGPAQDDERIVTAKGLLSRSAVRPGETFRAALVVEIRSGYHINDSAPLDEFMIPTALAVAESPDFETVEIAYPRGRKARVSYSEADLLIYDGQVVIGALLKAKEGLAPGPRSLRGALTYQACNDEMCLPPKELAFEIAVPVSTTGEGADLHPEVFAKIRFASPGK